MGMSRQREDARERRPAACLSAGTRVSVGDSRSLTVRTIRLRAAERSLDAPDPSSQHMFWHHNLQQIGDALAANRFVRDLIDSRPAFLDPVHPRFLSQRTAVIVVWESRCTHLCCPAVRHGCGTASTADVRISTLVCVLAE